MMESGDTLDLSPIRGVCADKHSTGGVGDKTSLVLCPMVACCGVKMAKMSGRGLGYTGGTIDKLESFQGFSSALTTERFFENVNKVGFAIAGQTANLVPADKKLYALRDVTGTVRSRGLIASSIMSKKLAAGAHVIALDVKCGSGSFNDTLEEAMALAGEMVEVGKNAGRRVFALITEMGEPLGSAVGNALEVKEAVAALKGEFSGDLVDLCLELGGNILIESGKAESMDAARAMLRETIASGKALCKLAEFVEAQGGNPSAVYDTSLLPAAPVRYEARGAVEGYVNRIRTDEIGRICMALGGGRETVESEIDLSVGLEVLKKIGHRVEPGEPLAIIHARTEKEAIEAADRLSACYEIKETKPEKAAFIKATVR